MEYEQGEQFFYLSNLKTQVKELDRLNSSDRGMILRPNTKFRSNSNNINNYNY